MENSLKDKICPHCNKEFKQIPGRVFSNHVRWCKSNPQYEKCCGKEFKDKLKSTINFSNMKKFVKTHGELKEYIVECANPKCKKPFTVKEYEKDFGSKKYFCSSFCSHSRIVSQQQRQRVSNTLKQQAEYFRQNDKKEYLRRFGCSPFDTSTKQEHRFTSKGERIVRDFFITHFPEDEWTYGGRIVLDNFGISRDLYSNKLKICFEYDGIWHFKNICNQLELKRSKDAALEKWCVMNKYRLIRISESWFSNNGNDPRCIIPLIYSSTEQIIKCGDEYN